MENKIQQAAKILGKKGGSQTKKLGSDFYRKIQKLGVKARQVPCDECGKNRWKTK